MLYSSKINSRYRLLFCFFCLVGFLDPLTFAQENIINSPNDPYVVKVYPDGTKLIVRWSEIGKAIDHGESHGGAPKIVSYNMAAQILEDRLEKKGDWRSLSWARLALREAMSSSGVSRSAGLAGAIGWPGPGEKGEGLDP